MNKCTYIILLMLLLPIAGIAQKVIVIDTLDVLNPRDVGQLSGNCNLIQVYCGDALVDCESMNTLIDCKENVGAVPAIIAKVSKSKLLEGVNVSIRFDGRRSKLLLLNLDKVKEDTIRISKWGIYMNRLGGYEDGYKTYARYRNDSLIKEDKIKHTFFRNDQIRGDTLKELGVVINEQKYSIPLSIKQHVARKTFKGYTPEDVYDNYLNYKAKRKSKPLKKKFVYDYYWGVYDDVDYYYEAVLDLSTAP